jgi:surface protein
VIKGTYQIVYPVQTYDSFVAWQLTSTSATVANPNAASTTITITNAGASLVATSISPFVFRINVTAPPSNLALPFQFNTDGPITVKWGDGTPDISYNINSGTIQHRYNVSGVFTVQIRGQSPYGFGSNTGYTGASLITNVIQWGNLGIINWNGAFYGATNLVSVPATIGSGVRSVGYMFGNATSFNFNISGWDVSGVESMFGMFSGASAFNQPLNSWNVSNVTDMNYMFEAATAFNQPLNSWNVSNVTDMSFMFGATTAFNQPLDLWSTKVSKVTSMRSMFGTASAFNRNLSTWIAPRVTDAFDMFCNCPVYNNLAYYPQFSGTPIGYPLYGCGQGPNLVRMLPLNQATINFLGTTYTTVSVPDGSYNIVAQSTIGSQSFSNWQKSGPGSILDISARDTTLTVTGTNVTAQAIYYTPVVLYRVTMTTDSTAGARADISYNGVYDSSANVPNGSYNIRATIPVGYTFNNWQVTAGSGTLASASSASTTLTVAGQAVTVQALYSATQNRVTMYTAGNTNVVAYISYNGNLDTSANVPVGGPYPISTYINPGKAYLFNGWVVYSGPATIARTDLSSTTVTITAQGDVTLYARYIAATRIQMITDGTPGAVADISYNGGRYQDVIVPTGNYTISANVPMGYSFDAFVPSFLYTITPSNNPLASIYINYASVDTPVTVQARYVSAPPMV